MYHKITVEDIYTIHHIEYIYVLYIRYMYIYLGLHRLDAACVMASNSPTLCTPQVDKRRRKRSEFWAMPRKLLCRLTAYITICVG